MSAGFPGEEERFMFYSLTERIKRDAGDAHDLANLSLRVAGVLVTATLVFTALYFFVQALE
jgi:hypothetical protein